MKRFKIKNKKNIRCDKIWNPQIKQSTTIGKN